MITARNADTLKETVAAIHKINPNIQVLPLPLDITNESSVEAAFDKIKDVFGTVDVLVSNAATFQSQFQLVKTASVSGWWGDFVCPS